MNRSRHDFDQHQVTSINEESTLKTKSFQRYFGLPLVAAFFALSSLSGAVNAEAKVDYLKPIPLSESPDFKNLKLKPIKQGKIRVPMLKWPGDVATVAAEVDGLFKAEGLDIELYNEDYLPNSCKSMIQGETPIGRGTLGMALLCADAVEKAGGEIVLVFKLTDSVGGDVLVVRGIKNLPDMKGKTFVLQLWGPHAEAITTVAQLGGVKPRDMKLKWVKELTIPAYDTKGGIVDPRSAFLESSDVDGAFVISPDAEALTAAEGGAAGSKRLFSTKDADTAIADVYWVRADWFKENPDKVKGFVHALMLGQEHFADLMANKASNPTKFSQLMARSSELLGLSTGEIEASLGDARWAQFVGNVKFFTGQGTLRNFKVMKGEIEKSFIELGLLKSATNLSAANLDYTQLATGLTNADLTVVPKAKFNQEKVQKAVEKKIATEIEDWEEEGSFFSFEVYFPANSEEFDVSAFVEQYDQVIEAQQKLGGAIFVIEGHNGPELLKKAEQENWSAAKIGLIKQVAKTRSGERAEALRQAVIKRFQEKGIDVDESQFYAVGMGMEHPKIADACLGKEKKCLEQRKQNRRAVFHVKSAASIDTEVE